MTVVYLLLEEAGDLSENYERRPSTCIRHVVIAEDNLPASSDGDPSSAPCIRLEKGLIHLLAVDVEI